MGALAKLTTKPLRREALSCIEPSSSPTLLALTPDGPVAEWLRSGLQIRAPRFDSGPGLQSFPYATKAYGDFAPVSEPLGVTR